MIDHSHYILDEQGNPIPEPDIFKYARWDREHPEQQRIGRTEFGDITISTVFLGINHNFRNDGPPILYETMVFADEAIVARLMELSETDDRSIFARFLGHV